MMRVWGLVAGNPWLVVALLVALAGSHTLVYRAGISRAEDAAASEKLTAVARAIEQSQAIGKEDMEIASANIQTVEVIRYRNRNLRAKESAHAKANPLPANCVLDPIRLRNVRDALAGGEVAASTSQPDGGMPETTRPTE